MSEWPFGFDVKCRFTSQKKNGVKLSVSLAIGQNPASGCLTASLSIGPHLGYQKVGTLCLKSLYAAAG